MTDIEAVLNFIIVMAIQFTYMSRNIRKAKLLPQLIKGKIKFLHENLLENQEMYMNGNGIAVKTALPKK